jgi:hypothetical protein
MWKLTPGGIRFLVVWTVVVASFTGGYAVGMHKGAYIGADVAMEAVRDAFENVPRAPTIPQWQEEHVEPHHRSGGSGLVIVRYTT